MDKQDKLIHSSSGKRIVLVVDDDIINREMLGEMLEIEYEVIYAENGTAALRMIREYGDMLSLVMLDMLMPEMGGFELLEILKAENILEKIPVIVLTTEKDLEVMSLKCGASDFIKKPYDMPEVVLARVRRIIELWEDRNIIETTEHDPLTQLYNQEFFFRYVEQYDRFHPDTAMDAVYINIDRFRYFNEIYGMDAGNKVLVELAAVISEEVVFSTGLGCRKDGDIFLMYLPHRDDYDPFAEKIREKLSSINTNYHIHFHIGVYPNADINLDVRGRFDRAKTAGDLVKGNYAETIGFYDESLHKNSLFRQRLTDDFAEAIRNDQFVIYYQPKFDIRGEKPVLVSAEALVRWRHPELGFLSPGMFIPIFEENGMIKQLDHYVWRRVAKQLAEWHEKFGSAMPISVNVSRIDLFDPDLIPFFLEITGENGLSTSDYLLEITESAYTENADSIVAIIEEFRKHGFRIEMDDFGSGYSSLYMLTELPIDILKIDMVFVRNLLADKKNEKIFKLMIDIGAHLSVPVIAEGVETEEQLGILKKLGCDIIQGYFFSPPVPPEKFELFLMEE
ncbi:MAG: EAL domain-containing protein [Clostridia bacterium]|nr:EAL domain-containing protein [Clostridia bacterium]